MISYWQKSDAIRDAVYIPKYYNPQIAADRDELIATHCCESIAAMIERGALSVATGDEIGKGAYGTGDIPFVRTSDISNWEIKSAPKQGVSRSIYEEYAASQDVQAGDILVVRDGTYLIGTNCFITEMDKEILYQSHVLKLRVETDGDIDPHLLFLALNTPFVQKQIRSFQFTADIIDTLGKRFLDVLIPTPRDKRVRRETAAACSNALEARVRGKAFVKHAPKMMEDALRTGSAEPISGFMSLATSDMVGMVSNETVSSELGEFTAFFRRSDEIVNGIYLPSYYDINLKAELHKVSRHCELLSVADLVQRGELEFHTGDEVGKMAYDTGSIPFLRTSDFANWEINHNPKQLVSEEVYATYATGQDVQENDVLLVRDGTYLVGSSCIITAQDVKSLFCGGMFKFRATGEYLDPFLFLGLINSYVVRRQMRTKQFTRDVIDTLGNRIEEVVLPVPKSAALRHAVSDAVRTVVDSRIQAREVLSRLTREFAPT